MTQFQKELKKAFRLNTVDSIQAWDMDHGYAHFLTQDFDLFVVETEMGRKGFKTFDGAFNQFMKISRGFDVTVVTGNLEIIDEETFLMDI